LTATLPPTTPSKVTVALRRSSSSMTPMAATRKNLFLDKIPAAMTVAAAAF
jgi:hypothetical protein